MVRKILIFLGAFVVSLALALVLALVLRWPVWISLPIGLMPLFFAASAVSGPRTPPDQPPT
jgi:hypothetical protein